MLVSYFSIWIMHLRRVPANVTHSVPLGRIPQNPGPGQGGTALE